MAARLAGSGLINRVATTQPGGFPFSGIWKMPHALLRFRLPDEQSEFDAAIQGRSAKSTLWDIDQTCRSLLKHGDPTEAEAKLAERIRAMIPAELLEG
jgi:hypothetical protein